MAGLKGPEGLLERGYRDVDVDAEEGVDVEVNSYFGSLKGAFKVSSGPVQWYRSSYGTDFENSEIASPEQ